jgi:hypothetical protein
LLPTSRASSSSSSSPADVISHRHQSRQQAPPAVSGKLDDDSPFEWNFDPAVWVSTVAAVVLFLNTLDAGFVYDDR